MRFNPATVGVTILVLAFSFVPASAAAPTTQPVVHHHRHRRHHHKHHTSATLSYHVGPVYDRIAYYRHVSMAQRAAGNQAAKTALQNR